MHRDHHDRHRERHPRHVERHAERAGRRAERHGERNPWLERRMERRSRRRSETRDDILGAAREVLIERGAADFSLREVARRAGFSPAALYKYFDNKDDVVKALADGAMAALLRAFAAVPADLPPDRRAVELGMAYIAFARENPEDVAVIEVHEEAAHPRTDDHVALEEVVQGVFRDGVAAGIFRGRPEDAPVMAFGAWAFVQGLWRFERQQAPVLAETVRAHQRELLHVFVNGLKTDWQAEEA